MRVVNGGRPPTITLPAAARTPRARCSSSACHPGSREHLRASVDYDGIPDAEDDRFNLVLQRVGGPGSGLVEEQEFHRRVSVRPDAGRYVVDVLAQSKLARVVGDAAGGAAGPPAAGDAGRLGRLPGRQQRRRRRRRRSPTTT